MPRTNTRRKVSRLPRLLVARRAKRFIPRTLTTPGLRYLKMVAGFGVLAFYLSVPSRKPHETQAARLDP
jgi:hypothetical protein